MIAVEIYRIYMNLILNDSILNNIKRNLLNFNFEDMNNLYIINLKNKFLKFELREKIKLDEKENYKNNENKKNFKYWKNNKIYKFFLKNNLNSESDGDDMKNGNEPIIDGNKSIFSYFQNFFNFEKRSKRFLTHDTKNNNFELEKKDPIKSFNFEDYNKNEKFYLGKYCIYFGIFVKFFALRIKR